MRSRTIVQSVLAAVLSLTLFGTAFATQGEPIPQRGITVIGYGTATAPAESATVVLSLTDLNYGPPTAPQPGATPGAGERRAAAPAVDSLAAAGIDESQIEVIVGPSVQGVGSYGGPSIAVLRFTVDDPSPEQISSLIDAATVGAAEERLTIGQAGVSYNVSDCSTVMRTASENAIVDAREHATVRAELLDVSLGHVIASKDVMPGPELLTAYGILPSGGGCAPVNVPASPYGSFNLPPFDPTAKAEVTVTMNIQLTFEMMPVDNATPAS